MGAPVGLLQSLFGVSVNRAEEVSSEPTAALLWRLKDRIVQANVEEAQAAVTVRANTYPVPQPPLTTEEVSAVYGNTGLSADVRVTAQRRLDCAEKRFFELLLEDRSNSADDGCSLNEFIQTAQKTQSRHDNY